MSDLIITPVTIEAIKPHTNADKLEIAVVGGWDIITGKENYNVGDIVVHIPPDVMVPKDWAEKWDVTKYLSWKKEAESGRVRAASLRGYVSFGFLVPNESGAELGADLAEHYGITKYDPPQKLGAGSMSNEHPLFHRYTNIQNLRNFKDSMDYTQELVVTEKIHGCLVFNTPIHMADGSKKKINDIEIGDYVLGVDNGAVVSTKVTNIFNNGKADSWMSIRYNRRGIGKGSSFASVKCTPNHRFLSNSDRYVPASELKTGDSVYAIRSELNLTAIQEQILIGKMLGDGSFATYNEVASIEFGHKKEHEEYLQWTLRGLGDIAGNQQKDRISGYDTRMCRGRTVSSADIYRFFKEWTTQEDKQVPCSIIDNIGPIAFAFWYMDDGSLGHHDSQEDRALFATCNFNDDSIDVLLKCLAKFNISGVKYKSKNNTKEYNRIRLNSDDAEKFFLLIAPYVLPCMQYKLPERYRGHPGWLPNVDNQYKPTLVEQTITEIEYNVDFSSSKYDIETKTHNFFANGTLVHNSNSRIGWVRSLEDNSEFEQVIGTHNTQRKLEDCGLYGLPLEQYKDGFDILFDSLNTFADRDGINSLVVFGEIYGAGIQDLHYGAKQEKGYRVFDIAKNGKYIPWEQLERVCEHAGLPIVPVLKQGIFTFEELLELAEGNTTLDDKHIREGVVVRPLDKELSWGRGARDPNPKRMIFKVISGAYLARKGGSEMH